MGWQQFQLHLIPAACSRDKGYPSLQQHAPAGWKFGVAARLFLGDRGVGRKHQGTLFLLESKASPTRLCFLSCAVVLNQQLLPSSYYFSLYIYFLFFFFFYLSLSGECCLLETARWKSPLPQNLPPAEMGISKLRITSLTLCFPTR